MTKDMTIGRPLPLILQFSIPLLLGIIFQQFYNLVDTIIVGRFLGIEALSAVGASTPVMFLIIEFCTTCCSGFSIPVAQEFGAKNYSKMRSYVSNSAYFSIVLAAFLTAVTMLGCRQMLVWIRTPADIFEGCYSYLIVIMAGIPFTFLYNIVAGIIRAMGDSRTPFLFLVLSTILNIILDLFFILVLNLGVAGAAYATVIAQAISGVLCVFYMKKKFHILKTSASERRPDPRLIRRLAALGLPIGLQTIITNSGSVMLQGAVNTLGTTYIAAYAAVMKLMQFSVCPYAALDVSISTYCGQNYGARKTDRIYQGVKYGLLIYFVYSALVGLILMLGSDRISLIFVASSETEVLTYIRQFFLYCGPFFLIVPALNCFRSAIQGLGYSVVSMLAGVCELAGRAFVSIILVPAFGYIGVCLSDGIAWGAAAICVAVLFPVIMKRIRKEFA